VLAFLVAAIGVGAIMLSAALPRIVAFVATTRSRD
jgi:hypothetical protein